MIGWCEIEVRGGNRFARRALMAYGAPAAYTDVDLGG
jgi:hypothetical protein